MTDLGPQPDTATLVTGAAGGIGAAVVEHLLLRGRSVVAADLDLAATEKVLRGCVSRTALRTLGDTLAVELDTTNRDSVEAALGRAEEELGPVTSAVTAAGIIRKAEFLELDLDAWSRTLAVNLTGTWIVFQSVARRMVDAGLGGSLVGISSVAGRGGRANAADYAASKAGVISVVKSAALALASHGIRVNAVCPGVVDTPMTDYIHEQAAAERGITAEESIAEMIETIPLGRIEEAEDVAAVVAFLLSEEAGYVTGQSINVCGGLEFD